MIADKVVHAWLALLACACLPSIDVDIPLQPGEIGVAAVRENGEPKALLFTSSTTIPLSFGEDTQLFMWKLSPQDFVGGDGRAIGPEELARVKARFAGEITDPTHGSCERCLAPWSTSPQPIFSGDSCSVPPFAELFFLQLEEGKIEPKTREQLDEELAAEAEQIRRQLFVEWPGACACEEVQVDRRPATDYRFLPARSESIDQWPFDEWAIHPDGTVGGFHAEKIGIIHPGGRRLLFDPPDAFPDDLGLLVGSVAITHQGGPAFVVAGFSIDPIREVPYYFLVRVLPQAIEVSPLTLVDDEFKPHQLQFIDETHFRLLGGTQDSSFARQTFGAFYECEVSASVRCTFAGRDSSRRCDGNEQRIVDLELLDADRLVAALEAGGILVGARNGLTWDLACLDEITFLVKGNIYRFGDSHTGGIAAFPSGRVFMITTADNERAIMTADFSSAATLDEMLAVPWQQQLNVLSHFAVPCEDFLGGPGPDEITMVTAMQQVAVCNSITATCSVTGPNAVSGNPPPMRLERPASGWTLSSFFTDRVQHVSSQVFRRRDGGAPELVYGPTVFDQTYTAPLVLGADGYPRHVTITGINRFVRTGDTVTTSTTVIPGYVFYPFAAALDSSNGSIVVLSFENTPRGAAPVIVRVWEETASFEIIGKTPPLENPSCTIPGITFLTRILETSPGEFLALNLCGTIVRIAGGEITVVRIDDWDDPETEAREPRPDGYPLGSADVSQGIVWVGGHHGALARVFGDRLERFSTSRTWNQTQYVDAWSIGHHVDALRAFCPDRVLFASSDQRYITSSPRTEGRLQLEAADFLFHTVEGATRRSDLSQAPRAILGPTTHYVVITDGAWSFQFQAPAVRALITPDAALEDREGILWLGGSDRRLVLGHPQR